MANQRNAAEIAADIARRVLSSAYDPLLACRDLADLREELQGVSADTLDVFVAVSSEVDGLPIGAERAYWAKDALAAKNLKAARYRDQVTSEIEGSLQRLLTELSEAE